MNIKRTILEIHNDRSEIKNECLDFLKKLTTNDCNIGYYNTLINADDYPYDEDDEESLESVLERYGFSSTYDFIVKGKKKKNKHRRRKKKKNKDIDDNTPTIFESEKEIIFYRDYNNPDDKFFIVVVERETNHPVGICLIYDISYIHGKGTMGILIDEDYQNKGYGKEASNLVLEFAFNILNLNNMMLYAIEFNKKAIKMYKNIGFQLIGRRRKAYPINNQVYDEVYLDILKEEFNKK